MPDAPAPRKRPRTHHSVQRRGALGAAGIGAVFVAIIGWYVLRPGAVGTDEPIPVPPTHRPIAIDQTPGAPPTVIASERAHFDLTDRKDPSRRAGEMSYLVMEPLPEHRYEFEQPEAWFYPKNGRTLHIRADKGNLYMPDQGKEPEAGTITGNVVADVYEPRPDGGPIDPKADRPSVTLKTSALTFDLTLETASTDDRFTIQSEQVWFAGTGLAMIGNQVRERLEKLVIKQGGMLAVRQVSQADRPPAQSAAPAQPAPVFPAPTGAQAAKAGAPAKRGPLETLYHGIFEGQVVAVQEGRTLNADQLDLWARLLDNQLPPDAIAKVRAWQPPKSAAAPLAPRSPAAPAPAIAAAPPASAGPTPALEQPAPPWPASSGQLTLKWSGPCTISPLEQAPPELQDDSVALRFTSPIAGAVTFADSERAGKGHAKSIHYAATKGVLNLEGSEESPATFALADGRAIEAGRLTADALHGLVHIPIAGILRDQEHGQAQVTWQKQADFAFEVRDGAITNMLRQATFDGDFRAAQKDGSISGGFARADFTPSPEHPFNMSRLIVQDDAAAVSGTEGSIKAATLDFGMALGADGRNPVPRTVTATGHATADNDQSHFAAEAIEARLEQGDNGKIEIADVAAHGSVRFRDDKEHTTAEAEDMRADLGRDAALGGRRRIIDLTGPKVLLSRKEQDQESTVTGTQMRIEGLSQRLETFGPGTFDHSQPGKALIHAAWSGGMTFDNTKGLLDCYDDAIATNTPDPLTRERMEAGRIKLELVPLAQAREQGIENKDDRILTARLFGSVLDREGGSDAQITSERFVADSTAEGGQRRVQLEHLQGPTIIADNRAKTVDVPAAGRLVIVDKRDAGKTPEAAVPAESAGARPGGDSRGDTLLDWDGSFHAERDTGQMHMERNVGLTHRALKDRQITNLVCDKLDAAAPAAAKSSLQSATATGAVYATSGPEALPDEPRALRKELVADRVEYDAVKGTLEADAGDGNLVTFFDPTTGAPQSAGGLMWDLTRDRIEIHRPSPIVGPAGGTSDESATAPPKAKKTGQRPDGSPPVPSGLPKSPASPPRPPR